MNMSSRNRTEVSNLPSPSAGKSDLSAGKTIEVGPLLTQDIKDRERQRYFQTIAFYGTIALIFFIFCALFRWLNLIGDRLTDISVSTTYRVSFFVAPIVVLGTLGALITLALLKFASRPVGEKREDEPSPISLLQAFGTQALDVLKSWVSK
jgi:hypothetical protein